MSTAQPFLTEPGQTQSTESAEPTDETLMRQLAAGEQDALGLLHRRYAPLIYNLAAQTLDRAAAEEIAQDVFVIIWRKADTFDPVRGAFRPWVLRIAHMRILNELRRRRRRPQVAPDPDGLRLGAMADDAPAPEETVWRDYRRETVREAITHLPPPQRQALGLAFFEELTHEQVADFLDLPLGTAKTRIRAGLRKLRVYLAPLLVAVFALGLGTVFGISHQRQQETQARADRALRLITSSSSVSVRLLAAPGVSPDTHGVYRSQPGATTAVLTLSHFAPAPTGQTYQAWVFHNGEWRTLGTIRPDASGNALFIAEGPDIATPPEAIQVTREQTRGSAHPTGPVIVSWSGP